jgi:hypothetical protein
LQAYQHLPARGAKIPALNLRHFNRRVVVAPIMAFFMARILSD